jgi:peptide/nickel transport system permease protein
MADSSSGKVAETKKHSALVNLLIRLVKEKPLGTVGGIITLLLLLTGIFANFLAPYSYYGIHSAHILASPSGQFWLGTDFMGRDLLSRVIYGARISVIIGLSASTMATLVATFIGILCGYIGGKFDLMAQRFVDAVMSLPQLVVLIFAISVIGAGMLQIILVLGIIWGIGGSRMVRSAVIGIKENVYVEAARAIGCPTTRILTRHILPNIMAPIIIYFSTVVPGVILTESALSFLGFGIPPPTPSWGSMLTGGGRIYMFRSQWPIIWPGLALATVVYGVNMFGDAVRDLLDPRLRGGVGRYGVRREKEEKRRDTKK